MGDIDSHSDERTWLLDHRKLLDEHRVAQLGFFDKALLTLASGAISLSFPLATYFSATGQLQGTGSLATAWSALTFSLVSNLVSYWTGARDAKGEIEAIDLELRTGENTEDRPNLFRHTTDVLNGVSLITFAVGAVSLLLFAYANAI